MGLLRFLLALSVLASHSSKILGFSLVDSTVAVQSFFIISGFYISLILNEKYLGANSYKLFISNRFLRLFPVYWIILIITILASFLLHLKYGYQWQIAVYSLYIHSEHFSATGLLAFIFSNLFIFGQDILNFFGMNDANGAFFLINDPLSKTPTLSSFLFVPQAWSLALEMMFYLIAPFILRKKLFIIIILICLSLSVRILMHSQGLSFNPWNYRFFPAQLVFFLSGAISYFIYKKLKGRIIAPSILKSIFAFVILVTISFQFIQGEDIKSGLYSIMIILAVPFLFHFTHNKVVDNYIGELSYPIYISHVLVYLFVGTNHFYIIESKGTTLAIFTIVISVILIKYISTPIEKIRRERLKKYELTNKAK